MTKEEMISPRVTEEGLIMSCIIYTIEYHNVSITDIPGYLLQTDMEGVVQVRLYVVIA